MTEQQVEVGDIIEKYIPAGRYAVGMHKGSHETLKTPSIPFIANGFQIRTKS